MADRDPGTRVRLLGEAAAEFAIDSNIPIRRYFRSGQEMIKMAEVYHNEGSLEAAYVLYMKYMTLFVEKLKTHRDFAQVLPAEKKRVKGVVKDVMGKTEELKLILRSRFEEEEEEPSSPSPAIKLSPANVAASTDPVQDFRASFNALGHHHLDGGGSQAGNEVAVQHKAVEGAGQQFWRPWEDKQEHPVKMRSESVRDLLGGQKDTAMQTVFCCPPSQLNRRGWKRRRSRRDLGRRKERLASHLSHSTPSKSWGRDLGSVSGLGQTWCSGSPGCYDFGGLGNSGDWARLDWSSASTRGGSDVTRTPTGWPTEEVAGRLDWSSKAGTRGLRGGEYDWSTSSTRGVGVGLDRVETQLGNWEEDSNLNQHLLYPPYLPDQGTPSSPAYPPGQVTPSSPVYCDGCHSWGNLLQVTVSQTRGM